MDALTDPRPAGGTAAPTPSPGLPPETPLAMPAQALGRAPIPADTPSRAGRGFRARRGFVLAATVAAGSRSSATTAASDGRRPS